MSESCNIQWDGGRVFSILLDLTVMNCGPAMLLILRLPFACTVTFFDHRFCAGIRRTLTRNTFTAIDVDVTSDP